MPDEPAPAGGMVASVSRALPHAGLPEGDGILLPDALDGMPLPQALDGIPLAEALASVEARQRALLAAIRVPIITTLLDGRIAGFNAAAVALFGSPARLYGRQIRDVLPFVYHPREGGGEWQGSLADANGRTLDLEVSRTILDQAPEGGYAVYVLYDISRHAEVNRLREQLLYSVAHELRGPLMVLDNALDILAAEHDELTAEEFSTVLGSARRTARRMRTLMEDLLSAGSIQSGHFVVAPRATKLRAMIDDALEIVHPAIERRRQRVDIRIDGHGDAGAWVLADPRYARQVLTNLLANASKYSPQGSPIRIGAAVSGGMMRIWVEDSGEGIPLEQQDGLFERFYRVRRGSDQPGVGLGLAIAKGIVEAHGGSIGIDSEPGMGTCVWFTLPSAAQATEA